MPVFWFELCISLFTVWQKISSCCPCCCCCCYEPFHKVIMITINESFPQLQNTMCWSLGKSVLPQLWELEAAHKKLMCIYCALNWLCSEALAHLGQWGVRGMLCSNYMQNASPEMGAFPVSSHLVKHWTTETHPSRQAGFVLCRNLGDVKYPMKKLLRANVFLSPFALQARTHW